eukprot:m.149721 g.149721  ORF g.149721 m.149721 type:complete len:64 (+) comp16161_c1_seq2:152-343(+)
MLFSFLFFFEKKKLPKQVFTEAIESAVRYHENSDDFVDQVMQLLHEDAFHDDGAGKDDDDGDS